MISITKSYFRKTHQFFGRNPSPSPTNRPKQVVERLKEREESVDVISPHDGREGGVDEGGGEVDDPLPLRSQRQLLHPDVRSSGCHITDDAVPRTVGQLSPVGFALYDAVSDGRGGGNDVGVREW